MPETPSTEREQLAAVKQGGKNVVVTGEFTRPTGTTAYTAGDVVSNSTSATTLIVFGTAPTGDGTPGKYPASQVGGSGYITKARITTDKKDETAQYRLYIYTVPESSLTIVADNVPDKRIYADRSYLVGYIDFPACSTAADSSGSTAADAMTADIRLPFKCALGSRSLYGKLVNMTGTTPADSQKFSVELTVDQN